MPDLDVDTTAPAYTVRRTQFQDIVQFWNPRLTHYFRLDKDSAAAWRASDPFLDDLLRFHELMQLRKFDD